MAEASEFVAELKFPDEWYSAPWGMLEELADCFARQAEIYARKRAKCKADEEADRASGKLGKGHTYEATWNYYEGLAKANEDAASACREKAAKLKEGER